MCTYCIINVNVTSYQYSFHEKKYFCARDAVVFRQLN